MTAACQGVESVIANKPGVRRRTMAALQHKPARMILWVLRGRMRRNHVFQAQGCFDRDRRPYVLAESVGRSVISAIWARDPFKVKSRIAKEEI